MRQTLRRSWKYILSVVAGFGILAVVLYYVGWREIISEMHALGLDGIVAVIADVFLPMIGWILCWQIILRSYGITIPIRSIIGARMSGYAVSYLTPTLYFGGEPVRALMVADPKHVPTTRIFATIIVERFLGGLSMIIFILIGSFYAVVSPTIPWEEKRLLVAGVAFITFWILVGLINFAFNFKWISRLIRGLGRLIKPWKRTLARAADKMSETEDEVFCAFTKHWKGTLAAFAVQTLSTFFIYMRPQVFFHFSAGLRLSFPQLSLVFALNILLAFFLWVTPGGLGTGEAGSVAIFRLVEPRIPAAGAAAFSLMFKFAELLLVGAGIVFLAQRGLRLFRTRSKKGSTTKKSEETA